MRIALGEAGRYGSTRGTQGDLWCAAGFRPSECDDDDDARSDAAVQAWRQGLVWSDHIPFGLEQYDGGVWMHALWFALTDREPGPCGLLACVQAHMGVRLRRHGSVGGWFRAGG